MTLAAGDISLIWPQAPWVMPWRLLACGEEHVGMFMRLQSWRDHGKSVNQDIIMDQSNVNWPEMGFPPNSFQSRESHKIYSSVKRDKNVDFVMTGEVSSLNTVTPNLAMRQVRPVQWAQYCGEYSAYAPELSIGPLMHIARHELFDLIRSELEETLGYECSCAVLDTVVRLCSDYYCGLQEPLKDPNEQISSALLFSLWRHSNSWYTDRLAAVNFSKVNELFKSLTLRLYESACNMDFITENARQFYQIEVAEPDSVWLTVRVMANKESVSKEIGAGAFRMNFSKAINIIQAVHARTGMVICSLSEQVNPEKSSLLKEMKQHMNACGIRVRGVISLNGILDQWIPEIEKEGFIWAGLCERMSDIMQLVNDFLEDESIDHGSEPALTNLKSFPLKWDQSRVMQLKAFTHYSFMDVFTEIKGESETSLSDLTNNRKDTIPPDLAALLMPIDSSLFGERSFTDFTLGASDGVALPLNSIDSTMLKEMVLIARIARYEQNTAAEMMCMLAGFKDVYPGDRQSISLMLSPALVMASQLVAVLFNIFFTRRFSTGYPLWNLSSMAVLHGLRMGNRDKDRAPRFERRRFSCNRPVPEFLGISDQMCGALVDRCNAARVCMESFIRFQPLIRISDVPELSRAWTDMISAPYTGRDNKDLLDSFIKTFTDTVCSESGALHAGLDNVQAMQLQDMVNLAHKSMSAKTSAEYANARAEVVYHNEYGKTARGVEMLNNLIKGFARAQGNEYMSTEDHLNKFIDSKFLRLRCTCTDVFTRLTAQGETSILNLSNVKPESKHAYALPVLADGNQGSDVSDSTMATDSKDHIINFPADYDDYDRSDDDESYDDDYDEDDDYEDDDDYDDYDDDDDEDDDIYRDYGLYGPGNVRYGDEDDLMPYFNDVKIPEKAWVDKKTGKVYSRKPVTSVSTGRVSRRMRKKSHTQINQESNTVNGKLIGHVTDDGRMRPYPEFKTEFPEYWEECVNEIGTFDFSEPSSFGTFIFAACHPVIREFSAMMDRYTPDISALGDVLLDCAVNYYARGMELSPEDISESSRRAFAFIPAPVGADFIIMAVSCIRSEILNPYRDMLQPLITDYVKDICVHNGDRQAGAWISVNKISGTYNIFDDDDDGYRFKAFYCVMGFAESYAAPLNYVLVEGSKTLKEAVNLMKVRLEADKVKVKGVIIGSDINADMQSFGELEDMGLRWIHMCSLNKSTHREICNELGKELIRESDRIDGQRVAVTCARAVNVNGVAYTRAALTGSAKFIRKSVELEKVRHAMTSKDADNGYDRNKVDSYSITVYGESMMYKGRFTKAELTGIGNIASTLADMLAMTRTFDLGYTRHQAPDSVENAPVLFNSLNHPDVARNLLFIAYLGTVLSLREYRVDPFIKEVGRHNALCGMQFKISKSNDGYHFRLTGFEHVREVLEKLGISNEELDLFKEKYGQFLEYVDLMRLERPISDVSMVLLKKFRLSALGIDGKGPCMFSSAETLSTSSFRFYAAGAAQAMLTGSAADCDVTLPNGGFTSKKMLIIGLKARRQYLDLKPQANTFTGEADAICSLFGLSENVKKYIEVIRMCSMAMKNR